MYAIGGICEKSPGLIQKKFKNEHAIHASECVKDLRRNALAGTHPHIFPTRSPLSAEKKTEQLSISK
jgi:hypothetical protein